jgi:uncharacterized protein (DUF362 family)
MLDFIKCPSYKEASEKTQLLLSQLNYKPQKSKVFIKPNVGATSYRVNTDPEVVKGIIRYLHNFTADIVIGEGAVETEYESTPYNFHHQGWDKLAEEEGVTLLDLNRCDREPYSWKYGAIELPSILSTHSYINVAKMKTHMQTTVSLCTKNQKGLLDSPTRKQFHRLGLHEPIAELAKIVHPELCLVDAVEGVEGNGPAEMGDMKHVGLIIGGEKMLDVDSYCCSIMGISPVDVGHLKLSGLLDPTNFYVFRDPKNQSSPFKLPDAEFRIMNVHMRPCHACTACLSSVGKMSKLAKRGNKGRFYFIKNGILTRLDIVVGTHATIPKDHGTVILYGDCTKELSNQYPEYIFFSGCPPVSQEVLEELTK